MSILAFSPDYKSALSGSKKIRSWEKIISLSNNLYNQLDLPKIDDDPWKSLRNLVDNQNKAQNNLILEKLHIYYSIFSQEDLAEHIKSKIGISYYEFISCSFWLYSIFLNKSYKVEKQYFFKENEFSEIFNAKNIDKVLEILSIPYSELKNILRQEFRYDINLFKTQGDIHIRLPIFEHSNDLYCLFSEFLLYQITAGMYYIGGFDNDKIGKLGNSFGASFEKITGEILKRENNKFKISPEILYSKGNGRDKGGRSSDWIVEDENEIVFIECKTFRLRLNSRKDEVLENDIEKFSKAIFQLYKVYFDYCEGKIGGLDFLQSKRFFPLVITLEECWASVPDITKKIKERTIQLLADENLDIMIIERYPFKISSILDFERKIQIMIKEGFGQYYDNKNMYMEYSYKMFYSDEIEKLFVKPLKEMSGG